MIKGKSGSSFPILTLSLDFELCWGVFDKVSLDERKNYFLQTRDKAIPALLELFANYGIQATWATVGMLFCDGKEELLQYLPKLQPNYRQHGLSAYKYLQQGPIGKSEADDPFHFAPSLIRHIAAQKGQEIGSHTFSHYYCLEEGQSITAFEADLMAAVEVAAYRGIKVQSLVFPRNQYNEAYLPVCERLGFTAVRGNASSWVWKPEANEKEGRRKRLSRLADSYLNIFGYNSYPTPRFFGAMMDIPASRLLRPYASYLKTAEHLKTERICRDIRYAAQKGHLYHLWWHPHNFGSHTEKNLDNLKRILDCFAACREEYGMQSLHMRGVYEHFQT
jgi:peptidoglycan/xylan/chitin deacetylase (PgdA/CDA1 family)